MTKHDKEVQRYYVKWVLVFLVSITVVSGIIGAFIGMKDSHLLLMILGELVVLLGVFFGFHMAKSVEEEK